LHLKQQQRSTCVTHAASHLSFRIKPFFSCPGCRLLVDKTKQQINTKIKTKINNKN